jgi:signal transduction histidine kinase
MKAEFLAAMHHELRSPLNTILGFAELMHDGAVGPVADDHKEYLGDILTSGRHLLHMIDDLLDLAKLEAGRIEGPIIGPIDLATLVGRARDLAVGRAAHRRIRIESEIDAVPGIVADVVRVRQIVFDALSNAVNCVPDGGLVTVRALPEGADEFRLDVEGSVDGRRAARFSAVLPRAMASS